MVSPLPENIKQRAVQLCESYGYLEVYDPGTWLKLDGKIFVFVHDQKKRGLWISWPDESVQPEVISDDSTSN